MLAIDGTVLVHTPPVVALDNVIVLPTHTDEGPVITPALTVGLIVIVFVVEKVPHVLEMV